MFLFLQRFCINSDVVLWLLYAHQIRKSVGFICFVLALELFIYFHWAPLILWIWTLYEFSMRSTSYWGFFCGLRAFNVAFFCSVWELDRNGHVNKLNTEHHLVDFVFVIGKPFKFQGNFCIFRTSFSYSSVPVLDTRPSARVCVRMICVRAMLR